MGRRWPAPRGGKGGGGEARGRAWRGGRGPGRRCACPGVCARWGRACLPVAPQPGAAERASPVGRTWPIPRSRRWASGSARPPGEAAQGPRPNTAPGVSSSAQSARALQVCNSSACSNLSRLAVPQEPVGPLWPGFPGPFCTSATRSFVSASLEVPASSPKPFPRPPTQEGTGQKGCGTSKGSPMLDTAPAR